MNPHFFFFFFFNDTATTEIYTLSLHDALPISIKAQNCARLALSLKRPNILSLGGVPVRGRDRKSTRLNSSHSQISYAVFCLKKKKNTFELLARDRPYLSAYARLVYHSVQSSRP